MAVASAAAPPVVFIEAELSARHGDEHIRHPQLNLLACVGDLVAVPAARARLLGERFALGDGQSGEEGLEVHAPKFTLR